MNGELKRLRDVERWIGWIRAVGVPFAAFQVAIGSGYPPGYRVWAWVTTVIFAAGAAVLFLLSRREWPRPAQRRLGLAALTFDFAIVSAYVLIYSFEQASPVRQIMFLPLVEAALRYGILGALVLPAASAPVMATFEWLRERHSAPRSYHVDYVTLQLGIEVMMGLIVGWLVLRLVAQLLAPAGAGLRRLHPRGARAAPVRPGGDRAQRGGKGPGDGSGGGGRGGGTATRLGAADSRNAAGGAPAHEPDHLPARHGGGRFPRGGGVPRAGAALPARDAAASGGAYDRDALARPARAGVVHGRGDRAGGSARPARGERRTEHPGLRGRAQDRRGAAAPVGSARGLRLARLARASDSDGGGDRLGPHTAAALARALARPARVVPRADRERDGQAGDADQRRAGHLAHRGGNLQLPLQRRRRRAARARLRGDRATRARRGAGACRGA